MQESRCIAGIDVHKKMLAVVVGRTEDRSLQLATREVRDHDGRLGTTE